MAKKTVSPTTGKPIRRKKGRPAGAKNKPIRKVTLERTRCPRCGSTERVQYWNTRRREIPGRRASGELYEAIVWRRTRCMDCQQHRDDVEYITPKIDKR